METFGPWLLEELKKRNMTQSELARLAGLGSGTISNIMNGQKKVGQDTALAIANVLRLPPDLVFEKAGILPPRPPFPLKKDEFSMGSTVRKSHHTVEAPRYTHSIQFDFKITRYLRKSRKRPA